MKKTPRTWTSQADLVAQVDALRAQGMTVKQACSQVGCQFTYYHAIKREMGPAPVASGIGDLSFEEFVKYKREWDKLKGN